jgi:hypothetical protein
MTVAQNSGFSHDAGRRDGAAVKLPVTAPQQVDEEPGLQAAQKDSEPRRAKNRRAEAYLASTL